jgi:hypothetical protein
MIDFFAIALLEKWGDKLESKIGAIKAMHSGSNL